jgi:hypothetical protein
LLGDSMGGSGSLLFAHLHPVTEVVSIVPQVSLHTHAHTLPHALTHTLALTLTCTHIYSRAGVTAPNGLPVGYEGRSYFREKVSGSKCSS